RACSTSPWGLRSNQRMGHVKAPAPFCLFPPTRATLADMAAIAEGLRRVLELDRELWHIVALSLEVSLSAVLIATALGLPLGARELADGLTRLWDARFSPAPAVLAGLGRAAAEVGAVMIVGGNIDGVTRVMTTAIALETSKGDLPLALGLGFVLIALVLAFNAAAQLVKETAERRFG